MCGRFALHAHPDVVALQFGLDAAPPFKARYNVCPGADVLVVHAGSGGARLAAQHRWGLVPHWARDPSIGQKLANARGESLDRKPAFRDAFRHWRCLVPASGYYEWQSAGRTKQPWYMQPRDAPLFALAGLRAVWQSAHGTVHTVSLITTTPNSLTARIHDRMPLLLAPEDHAAWLDPANGDLASLKGLIRPYPVERMTARAVDARVGDPANDDAGLLEPLPGGPVQADLL
jgi:putative SOS response-associated peptidase YedK